MKHQFTHTLYSVEMLIHFILSGALKGNQCNSNWYSRSQNDNSWSVDCIQAIDKRFSNLMWTTIKSLIHNIHKALQFEYFSTANQPGVHKVALSSKKTKRGLLQWEWQLCYNHSFTFVSVSGVRSVSTYGTHLVQSTIST